MSRRRFKKDGTLPPLLTHLIKAAKRSGKDVEGGDITGTMEALREFGVLASWALPIHGVFVPNNSEIAFEVQRVAKAYLGLDEARRGFRETLKPIEPFQTRDAIETAHANIRIVDDEAYFYAGLAFGIALASLPASR